MTHLPPILRKALLTQYGVKEEELEEWERLSYVYQRSSGTGLSAEERTRLIELSEKINPLSEEDTGPLIKHEAIPKP